MSSYNICQMRSDSYESSGLGLNLVQDFKHLQIEDRPFMFDSKGSESCNNPLGLFTSKSVQHGLPLSQSMLSHSEEAYRPQDKQQQQNQKEKFADLVPDELKDIIDFSFTNGLDLKKLIYLNNPDAQTKDDNKNILRNFGNAQNHYALYHVKARNRIKLSLESTKQFDMWVRSLKLENFQKFKKAWRDNDRKLFTKLYRNICWQFYTQHAIPYVLSSRIKKADTKISHLKQIHRFLRGISSPKEFKTFRQSFW